MGHVRLGQLPKTRAWKEVVRLVVAGANVAEIASATLKAAERALQYVQKDVGFREAVHLLTQIGVAASTDDPIAHLAKVGVNVPPNASVLDIAVAVSQGLEKNVNEAGRRSDFGEKARGALVTAVTKHLEGRLGTLFSASSDDVMGAMQGLRTPKAFGEFGRTFFAKLTNDCVDYFLSKTLSTHLGEGQRFTTTNQMAQFQQAMETHCRESSKIVESFCGEWFSKHRYEEDGEISRKSAEGFGWFALEKMRSELGFEGGDGDG